MHCSKCGAQNTHNESFCSRCGNKLEKENQAVSNLSDNKKIGTFEQLDIISREIEKLGTFHKLGYYIEGFFILLFFSIYTLFIGPIIVYFWGKKGWPRNILVKAVLYYDAYIFSIIMIGIILFIMIFVIAALVFGGIGPDVYDEQPGLSLFKDQ